MKEAGGGQAPMTPEVRLKMRVNRRDGTVEHHETPWSSIPEEEQRRLWSIPSFREWFDKQRGNK